jgi:hypothetical protein
MVQDRMVGENRVLGVGVRAFGRTPAPPRLSECVITNDRVPTNATG